MAIFGIDVSLYQSSINYTAARIAKVRFAMVKATQGHKTRGDAYLFCDPLFKAHVEGFYKAGIPIGAYHFLTAVTIEEAYREADYFLSVVEPYRDKIRLYLACDAEKYNNKYLSGLNRGQLTMIIDAFCKRVEAAGFKACIYTNTDHIRYHIDLSKLDYPVWQARYIRDGGVKRPTDAGDKLAIHQYRNDGEIPGVIGQYDFDFGYAPLARLMIGNLCGIMDVTLDYIAANKTGENILLRLADMVSAKTLNPVRNPTHERMITQVRSHCGLSVDETAYLADYTWAEDLFRKLYYGMLKRGTA